MLKKVYFSFFDPSRRFRLYLNRMYWWYSLPTPFKFVSYIFRYKIVKKFGCHVSPKSVIHPTVHFPHPVGIVVGDGVKIGADSIIYQHVTLGAARKGEGKLSMYPVLKDGVIVYCGAVIVGNLVLEDGVVVGANSVVLTSFPKKSVVVGSPALAKSL